MRNLMMVSILRGCYGGNDGWYDGYESAVKNGRCVIIAFVTLYRIGGILQIIIANANKISKLIFLILKMRYCTLMYYVNNVNFMHKSKSGFSLIELSIVLIIIGLLVAGVTGGASLIQSAKVRSMMNEIKNYERAVYSFQAARGRYPGDVKNYGTFGLYSNYTNMTNAPKPYYTYTTADFPSDFIKDFKNETDDVPNDASAPFAELYLEGITDFKPTGNGLVADKDYEEKGVPSMNFDPGVIVQFVHTSADPDYKSAPCGNNQKNCFYAKGIAHNGQIKEALYLQYMGSSMAGLSPKILKSVDEKLDDGKYNTGIFRTGCFGLDASGSPSNYGFGYADYDYAIANGKGCWDLLYSL